MNIDAYLDELSPQQLQTLLYDYELNTRPEQRMPTGDWNIWVVLAGRGWGKTHCASWNINKLITNSKDERIAFIAPTARDTNKTMVLGESGFLNTFPDKQRPKYNKAETRVICDNNNIIDLFEAAASDRIRGGNFSFAVIDEFCSCKDPQYVLDMTSLALRKGKNPRLIIITTPKPIKALKKLLEDAKDPANKIIVTKGSSFDNKFLPDTFVQALKRTYEGTSIGRQEIDAEILESGGALFSRGNIEKGRLPKTVLKDMQFKRIVVAVDPAVSKNENSDLTGIVVIGLALINGEPHAYVLEDASMKGTPAEWGKTVLTLYYKYKADRIVAEVNQGGDMVEHVIKTLDKTASYSSVRATRGKYVRAEPVASLYEQGKVHHVGLLKELEDQMVDYNPLDSEDSPDRMDALVWGIHELILQKQGTMGLGIASTVI